MSSRLAAQKMDMRLNNSLAVKRPGIYSITHLPSGNVYVGSAVRLDKRFAQHYSALKRGAHTNIKLQRAWSKYGEASFSFAVIEYVQDVTTLIQQEQLWIDSLHALDGYNVAPRAGSSLGRTASEETRRKLSLAKKGRPLSIEHRAALMGHTCSEQTRLRIAVAHKGKSKVPHTTEWRIMMSAKMVGRKHTPATIAKMSIAQKGRAVTDEARANMSQAQRLRPPITEEVRLKLSEAGKGRVLSAETKRKISMSHLGKKQGPVPDHLKAPEASRQTGRPCAERRVVPGVIVKSPS